MAFVKILKNTTGSPISISDTGATLPASPATYTIPETDYLLWAASTDITSPVTVGDVNVNDGTSDLSVANGLDLLKQGEANALWNANKINGITVDNTDIANGKILKYNSTSGNLEYEVDETSASVFGTEYNTNSSLGSSTTSSTTFQEKLSLVISPAIPAGDYFIGWNFEYQLNNDRSKCEFRIQIDNTTKVLATDPRSGQDDTDGYRHVGGYRSFSLTNATHTIDLDYRRLNSDNNGSVTIREAVLMLWRIS